MNDADDLCYLDLRKVNFRSTRSRQKQRARIKTRMSTQKDVTKFYYRGHKAILLEKPDAQPSKRGGVTDSIASSPGCVSSTKEKCTLTAEALGSSGCK